MVEAVWEDLFPFFLEPDLFIEHFGKAPIRNRNLFAAWWCDYQVNNGGFYWFFWNPAGVLVPEAERALREVGLPDAASVVNKSLQLFPVPYPRNRMVRWGYLETADRSALDSMSGEYADRSWSENGGFQLAAGRYARRNGISNRGPVETDA
jgi:hypothetical protein